MPKGLILYQRCGLHLSRPNGSVTYTYDAMNRLSSSKTLGTACTAVNGGTLNWGESYTIDAWGNLTGETATLCTADSLSTSATALNQLAAATYDSAGNAVTYGSQSYVYDAEGRTTSSAGTTYVYEGAGQRVSKPGKLYWRGASSDALAETSATDTNPTRYIFFGGKRIARIDPGATTPKYYVSDNLGSTAMTTDYLGNVLSESEYFPYGVEQKVATGDTNDYKFTGKERDAESGNDYFGARYYSSALGRFLSPDWDAKPTAVPYASFGDPQTLNLYAYAENGPVNRVDADGHVAQASYSFEGFGFPAGGEPIECALNIACADEMALNVPGSEEQMDVSTSDSDQTATQAATSAESQVAQAQGAIGKLLAAMSPVVEDFSSIGAAEPSHVGYSITTGEISLVDTDAGSSRVIGAGYSGKGAGLNNPDMEDVAGAKGKPDAGPIPEGKYTIGKQQDNVTGLGTKLPGSERLTPYGGNDMHGRGGFLIHGDKSIHDNTASEGFIVTSRGTREAIGNSGYSILRVDR